MWPSASGHLAKGSWLMIGTYTPEYVCSYCIYTYIKYIYYILIQYIPVSKGRGQHHLFTRATTHIFWEEHARTKKHVHHVGELLVQDATVTEFSHIASRLCQTSLPKNLKTRPLAQELITSPNGKPDKLTPMRSPRNFSGQVLGVFSIWLFVLDDWFWDFEALLLNFKGCQKSSTIEQVKSKR